jgi:20S proteasome alpha/beta subunit
MTLIFGARCTDGVVMVADRKITHINEADSIRFEYKQKIFGILTGVVFGSSGSTDTFELLRDYIINEVKTRHDITYENVNLKLAELVLDINKKRDFNRKLYFELLVGVRYPDNRNSTLTHITGVGTPQQINGYYTIGIGGIYIAHLLEHAWHSEMSMERAAELGYFVIKYIEVDYDVNNETRPELFARIKKRAIKRFNKQKRSMK